jgi:nucleoid DNA-binding protein
MEIPPRHVIRFKPGREMKERVAALPLDLKTKE